MLDRRLCKINSKSKNMYYFLLIIKRFSVHLAHLSLSLSVKGYNENKSSWYGIYSSINFLSDEAGCTLLDDDVSLEERGL